MIVIFLLFGVAGPKFNPGSQASGLHSVIFADRFSFFFLCASAPLVWSPAACDFYVYFPATARRWKVCVATLIDLGAGSFIPLLLGVGLASGFLVEASWGNAYDVSAGALVRETLTPLGAFQDFCAAILALGVIGNNVPCQYSAAMPFHMIGRWFRLLPRFVWVIIGSIIYTVLACIGRNNFLDIFQDFFALIGHWTIMWVSMTAEEEIIFRRRGYGYNWTDWNNHKALSLGIEALIIFCIGCVSSISPHHVQFCSYSIGFGCGLHVAGLLH